MTSSPSSSSLPPLAPPAPPPPEALPFNFSNRFSCCYSRVWIGECRSMGATGGGLPLLSAAVQHPRWDESRIPAR
jgi:hypothetical protein